MSADPPTEFSWKRAWLEHRDNLPHVRQENAIYFATFRLGDSLPAEKVAEAKRLRDTWLKAHPPPHTAEQTKEYARVWTRRVEELADAGHGSCVLKEPPCRRLLEETMRHDDAVTYRLGDFVIMPNHVHAIIHVLQGNELSQIIKTWKSVSARSIGRHLGRTGSYWMDEYFDHAVRHSESLAEFVSYIRQNPARLTQGTFTLGRGTLPGQPEDPDRR